MPAATTDKLKKYKSLFSTTLSTGIGTGTGDTITPSSVSGLPTDTLITLTFDRVDADGMATPSKLERIQGIISGGNFTSYTRGVDGTTEQAHSGGAVIEMIWNADDWNDMVDWGLTQHNQDGTHGAITSTNASMVTPTLSTPKVITSINDANGNEVIKISATPNAENDVTVANAATGNAPQISATGGDTNIDLTLSGKGTGVVKTTNQALTTPKVTTSINDANGNEVFITPATASAVNEITVTNSATGQPVQVAASGGDTNIDLKLGVKGTGLMRIPMKRQGGHADSFFTAGTTTYSETDTFIQTGVVSVTITTAGTRAYADVTFPVAFGQVPNVIVSPSINPVLASGNVECYVDNTQSAVSTSGFRVYGQISNIGATTEVRVSWIAIGRK